MTSPIEHAIAWASRRRARCSPKTEALAAQHGPLGEPDRAGPGHGPDAASRAGLPFVVIAGACVAFGAVVGGTAAMWSDTAQVDSSIHAGISVFTARLSTPMTDDEINEALSKNPADTNTVTLPTDQIIAALESDGAATVTIDVDARQEGHRGMSIWIEHIPKTSLTANVDSRVLLIPRAQNCPTDESTPPGGKVLFTGRLSSFAETQSDQREIVPVAYGIGNDENANGRQRYCVRFTNPGPDLSGGEDYIEFDHATSRTPPPPPPPDEPVFRFTVDTNAKGCTTSPILPVLGSVDGAVDWGDGTAHQPVTGVVTSAIAHTYATSGKYTAEFRGTFEKISHAGADRAAPCLISVDYWGETKTTSMDSAFLGATNLEYVDSPPSGVTTMKNALRVATSFAQTSLNDWDVSKVTDMSGMFQSAAKFDGALDQWNTSSVKSMTNMFNMAVKFDQPIGGWNTGAVEAMNQMFYGAANFNKPLNNWDTEDVTTMNGMFQNAKLFNQDLDEWKIGKVDGKSVTMSSMFSGASEFNGQIGNWDTSKVTDMSSMFQNATLFNQDISAWNTSNVKLMTSMFYGAAAFNQDLGYVRSTGSWNTSNVTNMTNMFYGATEFNGQIGNWNVEKVLTMTSMFRNATSFTQDISGWQPISATNMNSMFYGATALTCDLSNWPVKRDASHQNFGNGSGVTPPSVWGNPTPAPPSQEEPPIESAPPEDPAIDQSPAAPDPPTTPPEEPEMLPSPPLPSTPGEAASPDPVEREEPVLPDPGGDQPIEPVAPDQVNPAHDGRGISRSR